MKKLRSTLTRYYKKITSYVKKHPFISVLGGVLLLLLIFRKKVVEVTSEYLGIVKNYYPNLPELAYKKTSVSMSIVISYLNSLDISEDVKAAAYVIFRNESSNGSSGINNNYVGAQADSGVWPSKLNKYFVGVVEKQENQTPKLRLFLAFDDYKGSVQFLVDRVISRGLYIGGTPSKIYKKQIIDYSTWAQAYWSEWVTGSSSSIIPSSEKSGFVSMLKQGYSLS